MIAEEGFDRELLSESLLSEEEVRELLKGDVPDAQDREDREGPRVLFVSRRGDGTALLRERLAAAGASLHTVRNPFTALDQIRVAPPEAVVTELELWAEDGALLLERLRRLPTAAPVLFLASSPKDREAVEARLRRAGAWGVLFQPLEAGEVENAARRLVEAAWRPSAISKESVPSSVPPSPRLEVEERSALLGLPEDRRESAHERLDTSVDGELTWLRVHFHLSRAVRVSSSRDDCAARIMEVAQAHLRPRAVGIFYENEGRAVARLEAAPGAGADALEALCASAGGEGATSASDSALRLEGSSPSCRVVLVGLSPAVRGAASSYAEDVRTLIAEGLSRD